MENFFKLKQNKTTVSTEIFAGLTTFMTMAYILVVNPGFLEAAGMDWGAVFTATALASAVATLTMSLLANYPFALAPGMGLNAFFAFSVGLKYGWQMALIAVFVEGIIFLLMSIINVREAIFDSIPQNLKYAVTVGLGLFIAFIGLQNSKLVVSNEATSVALGDIKSITVILTLVGVLISVILLIKKVKGALFWGIIITWIMGIVCQIAGLYVVNPEIGMYSLIPNKLFSAPPSIADFNIIVAFKTLKTGFPIWEFVTVVFSFLFVDVFDTIGTLIGVSDKAGFLDKNGKLPKLKQALLADAVGTTFGAAVGTSTVTSYVESASGVAEGGRTGLTSLVVAGLFLISLVFSPIFSAIPAFATAPALIVVGLFMIESVLKIDFSDFSEGFPAFICIILMPLAYSISEGLIFGVLSYVIIKFAVGKRQDVSNVMLIVALIFALKLFLG